jgi:type IV fimbrial biogenesis protein FimT
MRIITKTKNGFTLLELLITVAIIGIVIAIATPSFMSMITSQRAKSSALQLQNDLVTAKNEALKQNRTITFRLTRTNATDWCIGISTNSTCDCKTSAGTCDIYTRTDTKSSLTSNGLTVTFDNVRTLPTSATTLPTNITLTNGAGDSQKIIATRITPVGKVLICSPSGNHKVAGIPTC